MTDEDQASVYIILYLAKNTKAKRSYLFDAMKKRHPFPIYEIVMVNKRKNFQFSFDNDNDLGYNLNNLNFLG